MHATASAITRGTRRASTSALPGTNRPSTLRTPRSRSSSSSPWCEESSTARRTTRATCRARSPETGRPVGPEGSLQKSPGRSPSYAHDMASRAYVLSLPERVIRSALGLSAGLLREVGEVVLPQAVGRSALYRSLVDTTLRYVIEQVGGAKGLYPPEPPQPADFLARRGAGHAIELLGIVAFRVSPVWVLAALADLSGLGRRLIPEIAEALRAEGLVGETSRIESVDQLLDALEKTSSRLAQTMYVPPLNVAELRKEWQAIRSQARGANPLQLPSAAAVGKQWGQLKEESTRQGRSIFETSSLVAIAAVRALPAKAR